MSLIRDWYEETKNYHYTWKLKNLVNLEEWLRLHKYRKQRADRGWSDRDTWGAGEHIAKITAEMLQRLNDNKYTDWPEWFKLNVKEESGDYKSLQQVIDDITAYLDFAKTSWADDLHTEPYPDGELNFSWHYEGGRKLTEPQITARIKKWAVEHDKKYKKAQNAMQFFGRHFIQFWD